MVSIVESIMLNIMAQGSYYQGKSVLIIELGILDQSLSFEDKMHVLSHIRTMKVIVILNRSLVLVVDLYKELQKFMMVDGLEKIVLLQKGGSHEWHLHVSPNCF